MSAYGQYFRYGGFVLVFIAVMLIKAPSGACDNHSQIVRWVAGQMHIGKPYTAPIIQVVGKEKLSQIFEAGSRSVKARWIADHGTAQAENLMRVYLDSAVGLFDPQTQIVYIGGFLSECRQKAIIAHEIAHYFQYVKRGPVDGRDMLSEMLLMEREIEACAMERQYEKQFCKPPMLTAAYSYRVAFYP